MTCQLRATVGISLLTDFEGFTTLKPIPHHEAGLTALLDPVVSWSGALKSVRVGALAAA